MPGPELTFRVEFKVFRLIRLDLESYQNTTFTNKNLFNALYSGMTLEYQKLDKARIGLSTSWTGLTWRLLSRKHSVPDLGRKWSFPG